MNYLDIIILAPLVWGAFRGFTKGFVISFVSVVALLLGIYCAFRFSEFTAELLTGTLNWHPQKITLISFIITFIVVLAGLHLLARLLDKAIESMALGWLNRIAGLIFGVLKFALIISIVLVLINRVEKRKQIIPTEDKEKSTLYYPLSRLYTCIFPYLHFEDYQIFDKIKPSQDVTV